MYWKSNRCGYINRRQEIGGIRFMKEKYETPKMEIVEFESEDIITTSGDNNELPPMPIQ